MTWYIHFQYGQAVYEILNNKNKKELEELILEYNEELEKPYDYCIYLRLKDIEEMLSEFVKEEDKTYFVNSLHCAAKTGNLIETIDYVLNNNDETMPIVQLLASINKN